MLAEAGHVAVTVTEEREQYERAVFITNLKKKTYYVISNRSIYKR
jgi:hypothetical protein